MSCSVSDNYEFFILSSVKVLYKPSALCYNAICKIAFAISVREIQYNIMRIMSLKKGLLYKNNKSKLLELTSVYLSALHGVNARRIDA